MSSWMAQHRRLVMLVGGVCAVFFLGFYGLDRINTAFSERYDQIEEAQADFTQKDRKVKGGDRAARQIRAMLPRSLPGDATLASSLYSQWLLQRALEVGIVGPEVSPGTVSSRTESYITQKFSLSGIASLPQVVQFLHRFQNTGFLHRITQLELVPSAGKRQLQVSLLVEAISLADAPSVKELNPPPVEAAPDQKSLEQYVTAIVGRSLVGQPNSAPTLASPGTQRGNPNKPVSFTLKGSDPDAEDKLTYSLEGTAPEGASFDPKTGQFRWTPTKNGDYEVAFRVADSGIPSQQSTVEKVRISISDPPPPPVAQAPPPKKLEFDPAEQTFVIAILNTNGQWQTWVKIRTEEKMLRLAEGDKISVGSVTGTVKAIRAEEVEFGLDSGTSLVVRLGKPLVAPPVVTGA